MAIGDFPFFFHREGRYILELQYSGRAIGSHGGGDVVSLG
jgi:hypothetical protein